MPKKIISKKYTPKDQPTWAGEPVPVYKPVRPFPDTANFPYRKFERISTQVPFTQKEWASILHLSEKTLQRYSKDNKNFEGIYVDRILQIQDLIKKGLEIFTSPEAFYRWLKKEKSVLGNRIDFNSLTTTAGIQLVKDEIERIMYGVYI